MISCTASVSVSASYSRCNILTLISYIMTHTHHVLQMFFLWALSIYSVDTVLYPYALLIDNTSIPFSSLGLSYNLS